MGVASVWEKLCTLIDEANASLLVNEVSFWVLAGLYGCIAIVALVQLIRIHARVPEYGMTTQKLFHILNCVTAVARCIVFSLWFKIINIGADEPYSPNSQPSALVNVLLDFPSLLFFSTYTLLILFWSEIYHQARSVSTSMLRPIFILVNAFVYIATASVWAWMFIVEDTSPKSGGSDEDYVVEEKIGDGKKLNVHVLGYQVTSVFLAVMSMTVVVGFLFYGLKLFSMLKKFPIESKGRKKKLYEVGMVTATCCCAFTIRAVMIAVNAFVDDVKLDVFGHPLWNFLYYLLTEIVPATLVLWVLRKMPPKRPTTSPTGTTANIFSRRTPRADDNTAYAPIPTQP